MSAVGYSGAVGAITLGDIEAGAGGRLHASLPPEFSTPVAGVAIDSREVSPGDLFVALPGERTDGHRFIPDAIRAGANAVVLSRLPVDPPPAGVLYIEVPDTVAALGRLGAYWRQRLPARVVGITGSAGKTSTRESVAAVLGMRYRTHRSRKSYNNEIGLPLTLLELRPDTERAVLEMGGAYALGEIAYLCSLARPEVGVVTNVGYAHVGRMGTIEAIAETKAELVQALPPDGLAVLNRDDPRVVAMAESARCPVLWYGADPAAEVRATDIRGLGLKGIAFRLRIGSRMETEIAAPLPGRHSVYTVLAAAAVGHADGLSGDEIAAAVRGLDPGVRLAVRPGPRGSTLIDDTYNANPASMIAALALLAETEPGTGGRRVAALGDMAELGAFAPEAHRELGERAARACDVLYCIGALSRRTAEAARRAGMEATAVRELASADEALGFLGAQLREGDMVLIKGSRVMALDRLAEALGERAAVRTDE